MYKVVVVDDELWFREGIKGSIDWDKYDIKIAGEACDGEEALEVIENVVPDIVFADVRMPVLDGLELASIITEKYPVIKIIIVSGYEEFEYAKKAISIGVSYYLTKPVDAEQLISVVNKVKDEIRKEREEANVRRKFEQQLKESLPLLREKFLNSLACGEIKKITAIKDKLEFLNIPLQLASHMVFIFDIEYEMKVYSDYQEMDKQLVRLAVLDVLLELTRKEKDVLIFNGYNDYIVGIATFDEQLGAAAAQVYMSKLLNKFLALIKKNVHISVTIGVSRYNSNWDRMNEAYGEAVEAIKSKVFLGKEQVIFFQDITICKDADESYSFFDKEELIDAVKSGNTQKIKDILDNNFKGFMKRPYLKYDYIQQIYLGLLWEILSYMNGIGIDYMRTIGGNPFKELLCMPTLKDMNLWFTEICIKVVDNILKLRQQQNKKVIQRVIGYIEENYNNDISLNNAAEYVFLSPAYLSRLFKKETGVSFIQYTMNIRVEKATELLRKTGMKTYEIAREVGYNDIRYFTKMFKDLKGMTPAQYRESFRGGFS